MNVLFRESFTKDLRRIQDRELLQRIRKAVEAVERAPSVEEIPSLKRLRAKGPYYRIRVGDYRLGLSIENDRATFVRILHRREIYRYFP